MTMSSLTHEDLGSAAQRERRTRILEAATALAATAVNNAAVVVDPSAHVFPGHSSEGT